ncbi:flagellar basal body-associated FliL family protein [Clostridium sp. MSJ-4]|uniref:Flagellar protein FliL n=1 Tax=Clostridium simiarum TaxID=2841506 RepID=A0ABS6EZJ8_9CLOT|nr:MULTISPECIES: flagellar basal body-associated FliL family protein [Clostridium]MBU5591069.1 flagellar basal body-associated FliL family protein [Clostridium simiarum]
MSENNVKDKKGGNTLKIVIIILLALVLLGGGVFAGMFLFPKNNGTAQNAQASVTKVDEKTFALDEFTVNLSDENGKKYLKVKVFVGYDKKNKKLEKELEPKKPIMRDAIVSVLRSKKSTDMTVKGTEDLKKEILDRLNPLFNNGRITNVYFNDLLVQ